MGVPSEVVAVLGYDPFGPVEPAPQQPDQPVQPPEQQIPPQLSPVQTPAAAAVPAVPNELDAVRAELNRVNAELQQIRQPAPAAGPAQPSDPIPTYQYEIPDQVLQLMVSEDPAHRKLALGNVMTAVSRSVHGMMQRELSQVIPALARQVMVEHLSQQEVGRDFYTKYPALDQPHLRPLIYQIAAGWAQQYPQAGWNAQTRDAIAQLVYKTFNMQFPGQQHAGNGAAPPQAPVMMPTLSRPAASGVMTDEQEMLDLMR